MKHTLSHCALGLDRRTWRHNQVLKVLENWLTKKVKEINDGKGPKIANLQRINFVREGKAPSSKKYKTHEGRQKMEWSLEDRRRFRDTNGFPVGCFSPTPGYCHVER